MSEEMREAPPAPAVVAVTGASGFLGSHLVRAVLDRGGRVRAVGRKEGTVHAVPVAAAGENLQDLSPEMLLGADVLIHCAARVHQQHEEKIEPRKLHELYLAANVDAALQAARAACKAGVRRFVFVSTVHVHAQATAAGVEVTAHSAFAPASPYAKSKLAVEHALTEFCRDTGLELVIVRPPLVYGAGVKAKFARLADWVASGRLLPFGALDRNRRSFVSVGNLVDFLLLVSRHELAAGRAWLVADAEPVSTAGLIEALARASGARVRNLNVPTWLLKPLLTLVGRGSVLKVLDTSLALDISENAQVLGWRPRQTMTEALGELFDQRRAPHDISSCGE